ncbi:post-transcriptional regulator [Pullulanibacillus camelliae]|nr:post-transcriptional regulator [Pullulanibacillus camelliae]
MDKPIVHGEWDKRLQDLKPFIESKLQEFRLLGLTHIKEKELWAFIKEKMEKEGKKQKKQEWHLYEVVGHIMSVSVNDYMNKIRLEMFQGEDLLTMTQELL